MHDILYMPIHVYIFASQYMLNAFCLGVRKVSHGNEQKIAVEVGMYCVGAATVWCCWSSKITAATVGHIVTVGVEGMRLTETFETILYDQKLVLASFKAMKPPTVLPAQQNNPPNLNRNRLNGKTCAL